MSTRPARNRPPARLLTVVRTHHLTPHMVRVVFSGDDLAGLPVGEYTDYYIKLLFPQPGVSYPEPFDMARIREEMPRAQWPAMRTYTIRRWDPQVRELSVDFVVHGDKGLAGPWARAARPGDQIRVLGPGGGYCPDPGADWHLLVGDESALPAIAAAIERMPVGARAYVLMEVAGPEEEQEFALPPGTQVRWLHRRPGQPRSALLDAVAGLETPPGDPHVFVHGEATWVREIRRYLRLERQVPRDRLSVSGYWRLGHDEDGWQAAKPEWNAQVEAEQEQRRVSVSASS